MNNNTKKKTKRKKKKKQKKAKEDIGLRRALLEIYSASSNTSTFRFNVNI